MSQIILVNKMNTSTIEYYQSEFPELNHPDTAIKSMSAGYQKHGKRVIKICNRFMEQKFGDVLVEAGHVIAFMTYRVLGERREEEFHARSIWSAVGTEHNGAKIVSLIRFESVLP